MVALIYLGLAIALGDLLCRRFYRLVSVPHRYAAAILVGILLSTWFTYLAALAFAKTAEPLLWADLLFFLAASAAIVWLSRKAPKVKMIETRAPGKTLYDWVTIGALFIAVCVLLIGTLYLDKQGRIQLSALQGGDFARQLAIAQRVALGHNFLSELAHYASWRTHDPLLFFFQAGNLQLLGLNLAWSVDVLSVLGLASTLALVMALGELLFDSRVVGRLGTVLFFCLGSVWYFANFLPWGNQVTTRLGDFESRLAFMNQRDLPFAVGIFILVLIFLVDQYRQRTSPAAITSGANIALRESRGVNNPNQVRTGLVSTFITSAKPALIPVKGFVFSGLLLAVLPLWNTALFIAAAVVLYCLALAYGSLWSSTIKPLVIFGRVLFATLTACTLGAGVIGLFAICASSRVQVNYEKERLVKRLLYRDLVIYKIPDSFPRSVTREGSPALSVTAFEGGHGNGKGQFDNPHGLAVDSAGNIFVADTNNGRIEKFSTNGTFITSIAATDPNGIAIDRAGHIYVAEIGSKHRVQKLGPNGAFIAEWAPGFYGPRKIAIGPDDSIYVVDSGRNRIVKFSPNGQVLTTWGSDGTGDGQFRGVSSVAVDPTTNRVYVTDPLNKRIEVFDSSGRFLTKWPVPEWGESLGFEDLAIDPERGRLYASSAHINIILVFDLQGNRIGTLAPTPPDKLEGPSALALAKDKLFVLNTASARVSLIKLQNR